MKLLRRFIVGLIVLILLINCVNISCFANNFEGYEFQFDKMQVREGQYTIVFSDIEYYVMDNNDRLIDNNEANYIHSIFEIDGEVYLINIIDKCDDYRWQLIKLNIGEDRGFEIIVDKAYGIFKTDTKGIVVVNNIEDNNFEFNYYDEIGEKNKVTLSMDGFNDFGSLRNVKEIDIRDFSVLFLTIGGEAIEYNLIHEDFYKITDDFVWSLDEV